jgi:hypothetical protein
MNMLVKYRKTLFALLGLVVLCLLGWYAYTLWRDRTEAGPEDTLQPNGTNFSLTPNQFREMAGLLESAMNGNGTDATTVFAQLNRLSNADDWYELIRVFGRRENTYGGFFAETGNLMDWLRWEFADTYNSLDFYNRSTLNTILNRFNVSL